MQAPGNQGAVTEPTRSIHDQNALETARELTLRRSGAVERTEQHGNTTASDVTARRRHPQEHDERFSQKSKTIAWLFFYFCHRTFYHIPLLLYLHLFSWTRGCLL